MPFANRFADGSVVVFARTGPHSIWGGRSGKGLVSGGRFAALACRVILPFPFRPLPLAGKGKRGVARAATTGRRSFAAGRTTHIPKNRLRP